MNWDRQIIDIFCEIKKQPNLQKILYCFFNPEIFKDRNGPILGKVRRLHYQNQ
jgi:hypothetical protein